jgi:hypothetical protein
MANTASTLLRDGSVAASVRSGSHKEAKMRWVREIVVAMLLMSALYACRGDQAPRGVNVCPNGCDQTAS